MSGESQVKSQIRELENQALDLLREAYQLGQSAGIGTHFLLNIGNALDSLNVDLIP